MRILYWYTRFLNTAGELRSYRGLTYFELNLGTERRYKFNPETRELTSASLATPLPADFWGERLYNMNALVGENGSGKTAIMHYMMEVLKSLYLREPAFSDETLMLIEDSKAKYLLHLNPKDKDDIAIQSGNNEAIQYCRIEPDRNKRLCSMNKQADPLTVLDRLKVIYHTNTLTLADDERVRAYQHSDHLRHHYIYDCSTSGLMRYDIINDCDAERTGDRLLSYFQSEFFKQIKFFCNPAQYRSFRHVKSRCELPLPSQLSIRLRFPENEDFKKPENLLKFCCSETLIDQLNASKSLLDYAALLLCCACTRTFERNLMDKDILPSLVPQTQYKLNKLTFESFERLFRRILREALFDYALSVNPDANRIADLYLCGLAFIGFVLSNQNLPFVFKSLPESFDLHTGWEDFVLTIPVSGNGTLRDDMIVWLQEFIDHYQKTCKPYYFLDFSWGLSSGESNLLRLFATLYDLHNEEERTCSRITNRRRTQSDLTAAQEEEHNCDSVLLLLDEADLTYHPEWQRRYVSTLTELLPSVLHINPKKSDPDLQVVFSTHSPLMLGDMPKNNVTYLPQESKQKQEIESFGENIHLILKNSFFLRDGTLGTFATKKITQTVRTLNLIISGELTSESDLQNCNSIIDLLAPGPIRYKLEELYQEAEKKLNSTARLVKQLEKMDASTEEIQDMIQLLKKKLDKQSGDVQMEEA